MANDNMNQPPAFLSASSPEELRSIMMINNRRHRRRFHYFDIQPWKGKWYAWFELSLTDELENADK